MAARRNNDDQIDRARRPPALTIEQRENQLIALAYDVAEQQMRNGTASSQIISQLLRAGSATHQLEKDKMRSEIEMLKAKKVQLEAEARSEELMGAAIKAMRSYQGAPDSGQEA